MFNLLLLGMQAQRTESDLAERPLSHSKDRHEKGTGYKVLGGF